MRHKTLFFCISNIFGRNLSKRKAELANYNYLFLYICLMSSEIQKKNLFEFIRCQDVMESFIMLYLEHQFYVSPLFSLQKLFSLFKFIALTWLFIFSDNITQMHMSKLHEEYEKVCQMCLEKVDSIRVSSYIDLQRSSKMRRFLL